MNPFSASVPLYEAVTRGQFGKWKISACWPLGLASHFSISEKPRAREHLLRPGVRKEEQRGERRQITSYCGWQQKNLLLHTGKAQLLSPNNLITFSQGINQHSQSSR